MFFYSFVYTTLRDQLLHLSSCTFHLFLYISYILLTLVQSQEECQREESSTLELLPVMWCPPNQEPLSKPSQKSKLYRSIHFWHPWFQSHFKEQMIFLSVNEGQRSNMYSTQDLVECNITTVVARLLTSHSTFNLCINFRKKRHTSCPVLGQIFRFSTI